MQKPKVTAYKKIRLWLSSALLFFALLSLFVVIPESAQAAGISLQISPVEIDAAANTTVTATATLTGVTATICPSGSTTGYTPYVIIKSKRGTGTPETTFTYSSSDIKKEIDVNAPNSAQKYEFSIPEKISSDSDLPITYSAIIFCVTVTTQGFPQGSQIAASSPVQLRKKGDTSKNLINFGDVGASVISAGKEYVLPANATSVTLKMSKIAIYNKKTNKAIQINDTIVKPSDKTNERVVSGFSLGIDKAGTTVSSWKCDGWLSNYCEFPRKVEGFRNPFEGSGGATYDVVVPFSNNPNPGRNGGIYIPVQDRDGTSKKSISIQVTPVIASTSDGIDLPLVGASQPITITFDSKVTKQEEKGGPTSEVVGSAVETDQSPSVLGSIATIVARILGGLVTIASGILYFIFFVILVPLLEALLSMKTYTGEFSQVIRPGWEVVKNVSYLFFIIALLVIAISTIFRIQSYQWKHTLVQIIIAAVLINFSLVISQEILGVADTVQSQFLPNNPNAIRALGKALMLDPIYTNVTEGGVTASSLGSGVGDITLPVFYLSLTLAAFLMFVALVAFLAIRIVALWVLLMLSPFAYALRVLHPTEHYAKEWWDQFLKYAFFTPIIAFFLNLAAYIAQEHPNFIRDLTNGTGGVAFISVANAADVPTGFEALMYKAGGSIILIIFMLVAIKVANSLSIMGAKGLTSMAEKGLNYPLAKLQQGASTVGGAAAGYVKDQKQMQTLKFKQKIADSYATSDNKGKRAFGKTLLMGDYLGQKKHIRDEKYKVREEQYGAAMHDSTHVHGGHVERESRDKLVEKYKGESQKIMDGMTVKEIMDTLARVRHDKGKTDMEKQGQELATLVELVKRKETGTLFKANDVKATGAEGVLELLSKIQENANINPELMDRYAGRVNDVFVDTKQFQNVGVDIASKLEFNQELYEKFEANNKYQGKITQLQKAYRDHVTKGTPPANDEERDFINDMREEIKTLQIKKMVKLGPGEFAKNVKAPTLEEVDMTDPEPDIKKKRKKPNFLAWNAVIHMKQAHANQKDKDPTNRELFRKLAEMSDDELKAQLIGKKNLLNDRVLDEDAAKEQIKILRDYVNK